MNASKVYMCVGENFRDGVKIGDCGEEKTLMDWLVHLFPTTDKEVLIEFFKGDTNEEICKYILETKGKRLK